MGKRKRSRFITEAARKELKRTHLERVLGKAAGAWKDEDHPELKKGNLPMGKRFQGRGRKKI